MIHYNANLKEKARQLRKNLTDGEYALWLRLRSKQILGIQFYRQKAIGNYIVDFYAPKAKLVVEVDGSQHLQDHYLQRDEKRDRYLNSIGLKVLRFNSSEVLKEIDAVVEDIYHTIIEQINSEIPPDPPFSKGGNNEAKLS